MSSKFGVTSKSQRGFTLVEMIIVVAIIGLIGGGLATAVFQMWSLNALSTGRATAVRQVENAIHWISRDAQMAQTVQTGGDSGFPLNLSWVRWDNTANNVTYSIQNSELQRTYSVNSSQPTSTVVAQYIKTDSGATNCQFTDGALTFKITILVGGFRPVSETRLGKVVPKPQ